MSNDQINLRDMLERVWRARWKILLFQLLVCLATVFLILFWPRTYSSTSLMLLKKGRESVGLDPTANITGKTVALQQAGRDSEIKSAIDVLLSRGVSIPVVEKLTPDVVLGNAPLEGTEDRKSNPVSDVIKNGVGTVVELIRSIDPSSTKERAVVEIEKNLVVDAERKSEVLRVTYESDSPELAQAVTSAIVERYIDLHSKLHRTDGSTEFFDEQSSRLRNDLEAASKKLHEAKSQMGITSIVEQRKILAEQLGKLRADMMENDKLLHGANAMSANLMAQLNNLPERLSSSKVSKPNAGADLQRQLLYALQIKEMDARAKMTDQHPTVRSLKKQVAEAKRELAKQEARRTESTDDINPVHEEIRLAHAKNLSEIAGFSAKKDKLERQEKELLDQIGKMNQYAVEIDQLEREVAVSDKKFLTYAGNLEEARMDQEMRADAISSVSVAQPATLQEKPVSPSKPVVALFGALMCLAGPLAIALLSIQTDDTLISEYSLRKTVDVPVLGTVPQSRAYSRVLA